MIGFDQLGALWRAVDRVDPGSKEQLILESQAHATLLMIVKLGQRIGLDKDGLKALAVARRRPQ
ncbi:hypothetical protein [Alloyangia pacifica]|uniref:hypothetical protein n=1 Tax=Alloyangia pacifica TaxID=311180 RepID=UPI0011611A35|nr:hypothetical protein [Alloyangia pacifica]